MKSTRTILKKIKSRLYQFGFIPARPEVLNIFTTNRCNFSCWYCSRNIRDGLPGADYRYDDKSEFHLDDLRLLLDRYPSIKSVSYVGIGEPFLCRDLIPMAMLSRDRAKSNLVVTNGSLMHNYWGKIGPYFDTVSISLHGTDSRELQNVAGVESKVFKQFVSNVHYLVNEETKLNTKLIIRATVVVIKNNLEQLKKAAAFCVDNRIPILDLQNFLPLGPESSHECIFDDEFDYINFLKGFINEYSDKLKINPPIIIKRNDRELNWACRSFFNYLRVDGLGQVSGCGKIMSPASGNGNFRIDGDVFNNSYFINMRKKFRARRDLPDCCRYCPDAQ